MPEIMYDTQEAVPEPFRAIAAEKDGKYMINVVPKADLDQFRNTNIAVVKERDTLGGLIGRLKTDLEFDDADPDTFITNYKEMVDIKKKVADGKLVADTSLESALEAKTGEMKRTYDGQILALTNTNKALAGENGTLKTQLQRTQIDTKLTEAINHPESGALPQATRQILREAHEVFSVDEHGDLIPKDPKGNIIYGADGATPMTPAEFLKTLEETSPFFFKTAQGGGAGGGNGGGGGLTPAQIAAMSPAEKMNYGRQHNMNG